MDEFDDDEWAEMQEMYIAHTSKELAKIQEDLENMPLDSLRTFGHNIKGSGGMYGFDKITNFGLLIETASKTGDLEAIRSNLRELEIFLKSKM